MGFNVIQETDRIRTFLHDYKDNVSPRTKILVGISGGKDSTVTAAICSDIFGINRVIGVSIPDGRDHTKALNVCDSLDIQCVCCDNLAEANGVMYDDLREILYEISDNTEINDVVRWNHPSRMRMTYLYMLANQIDARVACTCNMSETYVGYDTQWGDQCGAFAPFQNYTATELKQIGAYIGVPDRYINIPPADDMCGQTDEQRWGFSYDILDAYLRGAAISPDIAEKIEAMHKRALFKIQAVRIPAVQYFPSGSRRLFE